MKKITINENQVIEQFGVYLDIQSANRLYIYPRTCTLEQKTILLENNTDNTVTLTTKFNDKINGANQYELASGEYVELVCVNDDESGIELVTRGYVSSKELEKFSNQRETQSVHLATLKDDKQNLNICVMGDSTGNEEQEWVRRMANKFAEDYPDRNVFYSLYNETDEKYDELTAVQSVGSRRRLVATAGSDSARSLKGKQVPVVGSDKDFAIKVKSPDWATGTDRILFSHDGQADGRRCWRLALNTANRYQFIFTEDGNASSQVVHSTGIVTTNYPTDEFVYLRFQFDADDGSGNRIFRVFRSFDSGETWTQEGTDDIESGSVSVFENDEVPYRAFAAAGDTTMNAELEWFRHYDAIDGINIAPRSIDAFLHAENSDDVSQTIEGSLEIVIYNGSIPGYGSTNFLSGDIMRRLIVNNIRPTVIYSSSHNDRYFTGYEYNDRLDQMFANIKDYCFKPTIIAVIQNPEGEGWVRHVEHSIRLKELSQYALDNGYLIADVRQAFNQYVENGGNFDDLVNPLDSIHPVDPIGNVLWMETVYAQFN